MFLIGGIERTSRTQVKVGARELNGDAVLHGLVTCVGGIEGYWLSIGHVWDLATECPS